jgi:hypothetical protein
MHIRFNIGTSFGFFAIVGACSHVFVAVVMSPTKLLSTRIASIARSRSGLDGFIMDLCSRSTRLEQYDATVTFISRGTLFERGRNFPTTAQIDAGAF